VDDAYHFFSTDLENGTRNKGSSGRHAESVGAGQRFFAEELAGIQHGKYGFFAGGGNNAEFDSAFLDVIDGIRRIALGEDFLFGFYLDDLSIEASAGEKIFRTKRRLLSSGHAPSPSGDRLARVLAQLGHRSRFFIRFRKWPLLLPVRKEITAARELCHSRSVPDSTRIIASKGSVTGEPVLPGRL
jgi:hypothetical protein